MTDKTPDDKSKLKENSDDRPTNSHDLELNAMLKAAGIKKMTAEQEEKLDKKLEETLNSPTAKKLRRDLKDVFKAASEDYNKHVDELYQELGKKGQFKDPSKITKEGEKIAPPIFIPPNKLIL